MAWRQLAPGIFAGTPDCDEEIEKEFREAAEAKRSEDIQVQVRLSNIPPESMTTQRITTWEHRRAESWWSAIERFARREYEHPFVTLVGPRGTGKTHLAFSIGWEWLSQGAGVLYYHVEDLLDALRRGYSLSQKGALESYDSLLEFTRKANLLILDDLGAHNETDWAVVKLDQIVDYRYERMRPMITTTNLALNLLPERIADRLSEGLIVHLSGESYRKKKSASVKK